MNRRLLGACFVLAMLAGVAQAAPPTQIAPNKIDPAVTAAVVRGENPVDTIVTGLPHASVSEASFATRAQAMASLGARSRSFFDAIRDLAADTGSVVRETWAVAPAVHLMATPAAIQRLSAMKEVRWVERDAADAVKVSPIEADGAGSQNTGGRRMIQAEDIWALGYRGEGIRLAVIDTGIYPGHEAFKNANGSTRIVAWRDWVSGQPTPYDNNGHGTHVAGTAAGSRLYNDPTFGFFSEEGVAPRAQILVSKFLGAGGGGSWANGINSL
ncbi:MAG: S8 family serine peptidase, partial [Actinomycetota bacterium]